MYHLALPLLVGLVIVALAQTLVIITRGIDLSVGSMIGLTAMMVSFTVVAFPAMPSPLALVLGLGMLIWLGHSFRLARTLGSPRGRSAVGVVVALGFSLVLGVAPAVLLAMGGL